MELKEYLDAKVEAVSNDPMIPETIFGCQMNPKANDKIHGLNLIALLIFMIQ